MIISKINSNNVDEILWWSILAVSPESILITNDKVGHYTAEIRKCLKESENGPV
jgi:hypothetical protein